MKLTMIIWIPIALARGSSGALWLNHAISDSLSPNSFSNSSPSAGASGILWVSDLRFALAFWNRQEATYITPLGFHSLVSEPSLWGDEAAYAWGPYSCEIDILLYTDGASHRISYQSRQNEHPSLFAGNIAWQAYDPDPCSPVWPVSDPEIWFWNGYGAWQLTDNDVTDACPSLYELTVAWESDGNIVYATIPGPEWRLPLTPTIVAEGQRPSLFKNQIAYHASDGNDTEIFLYDIETEEITQITDNDTYDGDPCLYDGTIVWHAYDGNDAEIFYWDGMSIQQLTDNGIYDTEPTLWGTGLNTTIAYVETSLEPPVTLLDRIICLRPAVTASWQQATGETTITWPSLEGRSYRVEYSDDLPNWKVAAESVPSAGYGETSWTDGAASGTSPPPSEASRRFYRVCEHEQSP